MLSDLAAAQCGIDPVRRVVVEPSALSRHPAREHPGLRGDEDRCGVRTPRWSRRTRSAARRTSPARRPPPRARRRPVLLHPSREPSACRRRGARCSSDRDRRDCRGPAGDRGPARRGGSAGRVRRPTDPPPNSASASGPIAPARRRGSSRAGLPPRPEIRHLPCRRPTGAPGTAHRRPGPTRDRSMDRRSARASAHRPPRHGARSRTPLRRSRPGSAGRR